MAHSYWNQRTKVPRPGDGLRIQIPFDDGISETDPELAASLAVATARVGVGRGHLLELVVAAPGGSRSLEELERAVDELLCLQLGATAVDRWIGSIEVIAAPAYGALHVIQPESDLEDPLPLSELADSVLTAVELIIEGLPAEPCHLRSEYEPWVIFELNPEEPDRNAEDSPQSDLVTATTWMPEMLRSLLRGDPFYSGRFTRHGERFCYVELADELGSDDARLARRQQLEDTVDRALKEASLGCVVGAGMGLNRSYVNLAFSDVQRAQELVAGLVRDAYDIPALLCPAESRYRKEVLEIR